ncbi:MULTISPECIES: cystathionine gamma-synthase [unclassified Curtobacterium]|jgi:cystathionine gamma-synthase|uniref:cystathionine gamma-synthase n=1 Tax=unclassified Curtobacterium TaxID=257496 RepID=UPI00052A16A6|nr:MULTISPECIES: cystathionine gamma-synthase [unclassified Curtobacterium]AIV40529.1 cystathionine gamma-synthase [Curtobacterium sp. MR_MD2014]MCM3504445.1 cystathionine gamma-synthase [Curtobacterium sp. ODYSSEY 48 V2]MCM3520178.1 cystathionine gamma-synthase [Curtobacterium sp. P97]MDP9735331.1 cystathionine gamma-synthase [Curtobacterium sp. 260]MDT0211290.1 cystathionine gamma-synthase [Curtobacterium sp. BRD11]
MTEFATRAVHAGQDPDATTGAVIPPIHVTSTYVQDGVGNMRNGYEYSRGGNPTRDALQTLLADLDGGVAAYSFASGLAAEDALLRAYLEPGARVVMGNDVYGGTHRLVNRLHVPWGVELVVVDMSDVDRVRAALEGAPAKTVLWVETPTNPLMKIADIALLSEVGHAAGALVVVDNTFASPYLQQPLSLGADAVSYSTTKYLGGHSDVVGGAVVLRDREFADQVGFLQFGAGAIASPFDAFLTTRGIKTLPVRMERHSSNAQAVAEALVSAPGVERVYYPGLADHPGHEVAAKQMRGFGGMLSVALSGGPEAAKRFVESTEVFTLAESLGGVESLIGYPSEMTHASVKGTELAVPENVVRLSVGIEDQGDLVADVLQALSR